MCWCVCFVHICPFCVLYFHLFLFGWFCVRVQNLHSSWHCSNKMLPTHVSKFSSFLLLHFKLKDVKKTSRQRFYKSICHHISCFSLAYLRFSNLGLCSSHSRKKFPFAQCSDLIFFKPLLSSWYFSLDPSRVEICRDCHDRRSRKFFNCGVFFSECNAKFYVLPE